jgi:hypothetical protein
MGEGVDSGTTNGTRGGKVHSQKEICRGLEPPGGRVMSPDHLLSNLIPSGVAFIK